MNSLPPNASKSPSSGLTLGRFLPNPKLKLREQLAEVCRYRHMSHRSESAYWHWIKGFIQFHRGKARMARIDPDGNSTPHPPAHLSGQCAVPHPACGHLLPKAEKEFSPVEAQREMDWRHPRDLGAAEVRAYLSHLASVKNVAKATQRQALNAIVFLKGVAPYF